MPIPEQFRKHKSLSALAFLRAPRTWVVPTVLLSVTIFVIAIVFAGSVANPRADLRDAPIGLVSLDNGAQVQGTHLNLGTRVVQGIVARPQQPANAVLWKTYDSLAAVKTAIGKDKLFAAVVLPADYTTRMLTLTGATPQRPAVTVLTNHGAGSMASSIGNQIAELAVRGGSTAVAGVLAQQARGAGATIPAANAVLLADPVTITQAQGTPLGERTGMGMTAFFYALLLMMVGFLGANLINAMVDADLGYNSSDLGPVRRLKPPQLISRRQTLLAKCLVMVAAAMLGATAIIAAGALVLDLDLPHTALLWAYSVVGISAIGIGTLVVLSLVGAVGTIVAMMFFVAGAIPVSGGAVPLQAMPGFWRAWGEISPIRGLVDGVRAIIYFDAQGDAGLTRGWVLLLAGLLISLALGFGVVTWYDRKGLHRIHPMAIPRIREFVHAGHYLHRPPTEGGTPEPVLAARPSVAD